jgi:co-chaperonin GroES (HSP10)
MKLKVLGKNILAKPIELNKENEVGLVATVNNDKFKKNYGIVEFIGDEVSKVKVGDIIVFKTQELNQLEIENNKYFLIIQDDVIAIDG